MNTYLMSTIISVAVPVYNEESNIVPFLNRNSQYSKLKNYI